MNDEPKLTDVIDWGQGRDDQVVDLIETFGKFHDAYYHLLSYSETWWEYFNQSDSFDSAVSGEWKRLEDADIMRAIDTIAMLIIGAVTKFDKFADGVQQAYKLRKGTNNEKGNT